MEKVFNIKGKIISKGRPQSEIFSQIIEGENIFVKRYFRLKGLGSWLGFSRLRVEAINKWGIATAQVVVYGEECFFY